MEPHLTATECHLPYGSHESLKVAASLTSNFRYIANLERINLSAAVQFNGTKLALSTENQAHHSTAAEHK